MSTWIDLKALRILKIITSNLPYTEGETASAVSITDGEMLQAF